MRGTSSAVGEDGSPASKGATIRMRASPSRAPKWEEALLGGAVQEGAYLRASIMPARPVFYTLITAILASEGHLYGLGF
jgi:hypothetical protein